MPKKTDSATPPAIPAAPARPLREPTAPLTSGGCFNEKGERLEEPQQPHRGNTIETGGLPDPEEA